MPDCSEGVPGNTVREADIEGYSLIAREKARTGYGVRCRSCRPALAAEKQDRRIEIVTARQAFGPVYGVS